MNTNKISYNFAEGEVENVMKSLNEIVAKLNFLITLTPIERKRLLKQGGKREGFVYDAHDAARQYQHMLPSTFDLKGFDDNTKLFRDLQSLSMAFAHAAAKIEHTVLVVGADAMKTGLKVYKHAKNNTDIPGVEMVVEKLSAHFKGQGKRKKKSIEK